MDTRTQTAADLMALINRKGNMRTVALALGLPYETVRDWAYGRRQPPSYVLSDIRVRIANMPETVRYTLPETTRRRLSEGIS